MFFEGERDVAFIGLIDSDWTRYRDPRLLLVDKGNPAF